MSKPFYELSDFFQRKDGLSEEPQSTALLNCLRQQAVADANAKHDAEMERLRERVGRLEAARRAYASEFALKDGEPDVGSIHENIRKLREENERLRDQRKALFDAAQMALGEPKRYYNCTAIMEALRSAIAKAWGE